MSKTTETAIQTLRPAPSAAVLRYVLDILRILARRRTALAGLIVIGVVTLAAIFAPLISPYDPTELNVYAKLNPPTLSHPLGQDHLGHDILSNVIWGARVSMIIGGLSVALGLAIGASIGMIAGYFGGALDSVIMRFIDALLAFPGLLLVLAISAALGTGLRALIVAVAFASVAGFARLLRGTVLSTKQGDYVLAAKALGAGDFRIMFRHVWPNSLQPMIVQSTLGIGVAILVAAAAGYLGVGIQQPTPDWGRMISASQQYVSTQWWLTIGPGAAIMITVLAFNLLGDGLRDALDPRLRGR